MDDNKLLLFDPKAKMEMWTENTGVSEGLFHELFSKNGDYFKVLGEQKRPHYKWVIFGPSRSGSAFHGSKRYFRVERSHSRSEEMDYVPTG